MAMSIGADRVVYLDRPTGPLDIADTPPWKYVSGEATNRRWCHHDESTRKVKLTKTEASLGEKVRVKPTFLSSIAARVRKLCRAG